MDLSTLVVNTAGNITKKVLLAQWHWISGQDVRYNSRIFIGDKVNRMYVMLSRTVVIAVMYLSHEPVVKTLDSVKDYILNMIDVNIKYHTKRNRKSEVGAALLMNFNRLLRNSWTVMFTLVETFMSIASSYVKLVGEATKIVTGELDLMVLASLMSSSLENILVGESVMKEGGHAAAVGTISFAALFSMASFIERNVVGILATTAEYLVNGRNPRITVQNVQLLKGVSKENPSQGLYSFLQLYPFAIDDYHIQQQLNQETEKTGSDAVKSWILGDSKLLAAVIKAKKYSEDLKKHKLNSKKTSKTKAIGNSEKKTGVRKVRRRNKSKGKTDLKQS